MTSLIELLEQHGAAALEKQWALGDLIGEADWQASLSQGVLVFGGDRSFPIQVLGSEAQGPGTWLWGWANEASGIPPALLQAGERLRAWGAEHGVAALTEPELSLDDVDGHTLAMVASGLLGADCYYRGPYEGGAVFLLLDAPPLRGRQTPPERMVNVFIQFVSTFPVNHRRALRAFMEARGYACAEENGELVGSNALGAIAARFDEQGRFTGANIQLNARG